MEPENNTLIDRQKAEIAFQIFPFRKLPTTSELRRHNYYSIVLINSGKVELQVELNQYAISSPTIVCISPYQPYGFQALNATSGTVVNFHPDFYCTYKHQNEIHTEGILFHNAFEPPHFPVEDEGPLQEVLQLMTRELAKTETGQHELLVSYLKIFLIQVVRIKQKQAAVQEAQSDPQSPIIRDLTRIIELNFRKRHSVADYASMLHVSPTHLAKVVRQHFNQTLTVLIANRIMTEAKRELYLTSKSVKEVSHLLGYRDEYYFSRFFKKHAGISPRLYRETVGFAKMES